MYLGLSEKDRMKVLQAMEDVQFYQVFREINFSADTLAKKGAVLNVGEKIIHMEKPSFLRRIEMSEVVYYIFC